jgi:hypothetical protein
VTDEGVFMLCTVAVVTYAVILLIRTFLGDDD